MTALPDSFFNRDSRQLARELIGKVIRRKLGRLWLSARIIETEAYQLQEKGSHASLGYTHKRRALFMDGGTIYMYHSQGGDSLNFSAAGAGNAVLIKSAHPWLDDISGPRSLARMQELNPDAQGNPRDPRRLCAGQALLCRSLDLKIADWDARNFDPARFYVEDVGASPRRLINAPRLGIPTGRDEHLFYRYVDPEYAAFCTRNPLRRGQQQGRDYVMVDIRGTIL
ncbi:MAG TPA: DNA-3-methyladenine glycosylase [Bordetella sp.]|uniref:DNA-3-methyladenine glycosylase n=1 Tax=Bordetella sp. TaxID=28081 RepID=UPI002ED05B72